MKEECLICQSALEYLNEDIEMECVICHKKENSKTWCINGHYVCNECHMHGIDSILSACLSETSKNPIEILNKLMNLPFCHMHGPEHHIMVGAALLTAYQNAGGKVDLEKSLLEMQRRGKSVPGGACGFWGACGAGISSGIFISIITASTPLMDEPFGLSNKMTARALNVIGEVGAPAAVKGILISQFYRPLILLKKILEFKWKNRISYVIFLPKIISVSEKDVRFLRVESR